MEYRLISMNGLFCEFIANMELQAKSFHKNEFHGIKHYVLLEENDLTNIFMYNKCLLVENNTKQDFLKFVETVFLNVVELDISHLDYNLKDFSERLKKNF